MPGASSGIKNPEEMDPKYKMFSLEHLPLIYQPAYKVKQENAEQLQILVKLLQRPDVDHAVNVCDADREGELIYREVYEYAGVNKSNLAYLNPLLKSQNLKRLSID